MFSTSLFTCIFMMAITYHYEQLKALDLKFSTKKRSDIYFKGMCVLVVQLCPILCDSWTGAHQTPLSMGFSRQEYWSGLPFPPPGDLPKPGIEPTSAVSPASQVDSLPAEPSGKPKSISFYL